MSKEQNTASYDPFSVQPLRVRTRRIFAPSGGSISFTTAIFLLGTGCACFYLLVPLEFIRPDIIGWNRTARARALLNKTTEQPQQK